MTTRPTEKLKSVHGSYSLHGGKYIYAHVLSATTCHPLRREETTYECAFDAGRGDRYISLLEAVLTFGKEIYRK